MKGLRATGIVLIALISPCLSFAGTANKNQVVQPNGFTWSGVYAGINAGFFKNSLKITDVNAASFNATIEQNTNPNFSGGFQVGIRRQMSPSPTSGVLGLEFSANFQDHLSQMQYGSPFALYQLDSSYRVKSSYLLELIGGISAEKTLLFLAAGASFSTIRGQVINTDGLPFFRQFSLNKNAIGPVIGAGVEYACNNKLSIRAKIDMVYNNSYRTKDDTGNSYEVANQTMIASLGLNYKFA